MMKATAIGPLGAALLLTGALALTPLPSLGAESAATPAAGGGASASLASTDLSGVWEVQIGAPSGSYASKLVLEKDGDGYKGTFTGADGAPSFSLTGVPTGDRIVFKSADGTQTYPARLVDGLLRGTYVQDGQEQSWTARRPKSSAALSAIAGRWKVTMDGPNGNAFEREMTVNWDGQSLSGVLKPPAGAPAGGGNGGNFRREIAFRNATFADDVFTFATEFDRNGQTIRRTYRATLKGDALDGTIEGGQNTRHWKAVRIADAGAAAPAGSASAAGGIAGRWRMTSQGRNGNTVERELVLTQDGDRVTGTLKAPANLPAGASAGGNGGNFRLRDIDLADGTFRDGELSFSTVFNGNNGRSFRRTYRAKLNGDTLDGTSEGQGGANGQGGQPRPWKATRIGGSATAAAGGISGTWTMTTQGRNGNVTSRDLILTQDGEKVTGTLKAAARPAGAGNGGNGNGGNGFRSRDAAIADGSFRNGELTFTITYTTGNGNTRTRTYRAKLNGDTLDGTIEGGGGGNGNNGGGGPRTWKATRSGGTAASARAAGDLSGEWDVAIKTTNQTYTAVVALNREGAGWAGEYRTQGPNSTELKAPVRDFTADGDKVKFSVDLPLNFQGRTNLHIDFSGTRDGDSIAGNETTTFGTSEFTMKRRGAASASAATSAAGEWTLAMDGNNGPSNSTLRLKNEGGTWSGEIGRNNGRPSPLKSVTVDGRAFTLVREFNRNGQAVQTEYTGTFDGDRMTGSMKSARGTTAFTGTRKPPVSPLAAVGEWALKVGVGEKAVSSTLILRRDGESWAGEIAMSRDGRAWNVPLRQVSVEGESVRFLLPAPPGQTGDMEFNGKFQGNLMTGSTKAPDGTELFVAEKKRSA